MTSSSLFSSDRVAVILGVVIPILLFGLLLRLGSDDTVSAARPPEPGVWSLPRKTRKPTSAPPTITRRPSPTPRPSPTTGPFPNGWVLPSAPYFAFRRPFDEPLTVRPSRFYPYGTDAGGEYLLHHGVDIGNPFGEPVLAVGAGKVIFAGDDLNVHWGPMLDFYGQLVVIEHPVDLGGQPLFSLYGHIETVNVRRGQQVKPGDVVGTVGSRGVALGPHLHLEFRTRAADYLSTFNPELFLAPLSGHGTIVVRVQDEDGQLLSGVPVALFAVSPTGDERWISEVPSYPPRPVNSSWRWDESAVFGDLPVGRYTVRSRSAFQASVTVDVRARGAIIAVLAP